MPTEPQPMARSSHDAAYKSIFAQKRAVADTLSDAASDIARHLDFMTLQQLPASFVTKHLGQRHADMLWRVQTKSAKWLYLMVLLEFQSTVNRDMALRMADYTVRILQGIDADERGPSGEYPAVLPIVVYNGKLPWTAPRDISQLFGPVPDELLGYLPRLRYFLVDVHRLDPAAMRPESTLATMTRLEQVSTPGAARKMLAPLEEWLERIDDPGLSRAISAWVCLEVLRRHGREGGELARSIRQGDKEIKVTALGEMFERAGKERDQLWLAKGIERGIERGRIEGERRVVLRLAARRFGPESAERLQPLLEDLSDPEAVAAVFDVVFESGTADELFARVGNAEH